MCRWNKNGICTLLNKEGIDDTFCLDGIVENCFVYKSFQEDLIDTMNNTDFEEGKDEETMENNTLEKTLDMAGNMAKLAANLTEAKKETPKQPYHKSDDNSNNAHTGSQSVNVMLDTGKKKEPRPVEKHIHEFPENRPLTTEECSLALKKAEMEYNLKREDQRFLAEMETKRWNHDLEVEKKNERKAKVRRIVAGILGAIGIGATGYSIYTDYRNRKNSGDAPKALSGNAPVKADGEVK